jgi:ABC-2 type transport system permease protein
MAALRAEWTKLRTARGTAWLPLVIVLATAGLGAAVSAVAAPGTTSCADGCDPARLALSGVYLGQIPAVILGVLAATTEYHGGLIAVTLAATPRRPVVFAAKAVAVAAAALPAALLGVAGSVLAGQALLTRNGFAWSLTDGPALRIAAGAVLHLGLVALLGYGAGSAVRDTAAALGGVLALLYLTTFFARFVTAEPWHGYIERYAPMSGGPGVLSVYTAAALAAGIGVLITRDA